MIIFYLVLLALLSAGVKTEKVYFKGNLLFKENGANYLNQEHMIFSRLLDTNDLKLFTQTYQDSSNTYASFCDSIKRLFLKINPQKQKGKIITNKNFTIIKSTTEHTIAEAAAVCRSMGARLPEIRNREEDRDLLEAVERYKVKTVMSGVKYDHRTNRFNYDSDSVDVPSNTIYNAPYYGGTYTNAWHKAVSWSDRYLIEAARDHYLTYVKAENGMAFRMSDSDTMLEKNFILCQKPIPDIPTPTDPTANILIQMTMALCTRDLPSIEQSTENAIDQIQLITSVNLGISKNNSILRNYLPHFKVEEKAKRETSHYETDDEKPWENCDYGQNHTHPCLMITKGDQLWTPIYVENEVFKEKTEFNRIKIIPEIAESVNDLIDKSYEYWIYANTENITDLPFQKWLDYQLKTSPLKLCSVAFGHIEYNPETMLYPNKPKSMEAFRFLARPDLLPIPANPFDKSVSRRDLATIATTSVLGTMIGGTAYIIKSFIDMFSTDKYVSKTEFAKLARNMNDIRINQLQMQDAMRQVAIRLNHYDNHINAIYNGVAAQNMEMDIKMFNRYLQSVLATTLNSYAQAFLAAMDGKTSPYALSPTELQKLSADIHAEKRITLDTNINNVRTTALIMNNTIRFFFEVPIISNEAAFNFYSIIPVPAFHNNETFLPDIDATNIAISKDGTKYSILTQEESTKCMSIPPICKTHRPIYPTSNKALCVMSTYITSQRTCKMKLTSSKAEPFLYFEDSTLYFSVPYNTTLFVSCPNQKYFDEKNELSVMLYGMGEAQHRPSCTITMPDGTSFKTPSKPELHMINNWPMFNVIKNLPHDMETIITVPTNLPILQINPIPVDETSSTFMSMDWPPTENKIWDILLNLATVLIPIFGLILLALCCKKRIMNNLRAALYSGSYTLDKNAEKTTDEFEYVSVPLTPKVVKFDKTNETSKISDPLDQIRFAPKPRNPILKNSKIQFTE